MPECPCAAPATTATSAYARCGARCEALAVWGACRATRLLRRARDLPDLLRFRLLMRPKSLFSTQPLSTATCAWPATGVLPLRGCACARRGCDGHVLRSIHFPQKAYDDMTRQTKELLRNSRVSMMLLSNSRATPTLQRAVGSRRHAATLVAVRDRCMCDARPTVVLLKLVCCPCPHTCQRRPEPSGA
jgi:hypothetical protein